MATRARWLIVAALVAAMGCVLPQDIRRLEGEDAAIKRDVASLKAELKERTEGLKKEFEDYKKDSEVRLLELRKDIEHLQKELNRLRADLEKELHRLGQAGSRGDKEALAALKDAITKLSARVDLLAGHVGMKELAEPAAPAVAGPEPEEEAVPGKAEYDKHLALFREKKFAQALKGFQKYLSEHPHTELSDNALFWMGECYFNLEDYRQAIMAYEKLLRDYPDSAKVPGALLKEGMAFKELGEKTSAVILLKMVMKKHPDSEQAGVAKKLLESLEKE